MKGRKVKSGEAAPCRIKGGKPMKVKFALILGTIGILTILAYAGGPENPQSQAAAAGNPPVAVINDAAAKAMLLGSHKFSCQWISWDYFGKAEVTEENGVLRLKAEQRRQDGTDFVQLEGFITEVNSLNFLFQGWIVTQVSHINDGQPCRREGPMTFRITGRRKYWRLKEMENPCEEVVDYIDIYFR
jgi:hypothetical protein